MMRKHYLLAASIVLSLTLCSCSADLLFQPFTGSGTLKIENSLKASSNQAPIIRSLTTHCFKTIPDRVVIWIDAADPDGDPLKFSWSASQGLLSSTTGTAVELTSGGAVDFISTVQVSVSEGRGGTAEGALNVSFDANGNPRLPIEEPKNQPTPEPYPTPSATPEVVPDPNVTPICKIVLDHLFYSERNGNGDGVPNPGEELYLKPTFKNIGNASSPPMAILVTTTSPYATIKSGFSSTYGRLNLELDPLVPGMVSDKPAQDDYSVIRLSLGVSSGTVIPLTIKIIDSSWNATEVAKVNLTVR